MNQTPVMVVKPKFIPLVTALSVVPLTIFMTIWGGLFFGGFAAIAVKALKLNIPSTATFIFFGGLFLFGIPFLTYFVKMKTYAKTEYRFYSDKLDYYEGFFVIEEKAINYDRITEINLRKGIIQRIYGLGTITLSTPATGTSSGTSRSGAKLVDLENPDEVYRRAKELIKC